MLTDESVLEWAKGWLLPNTPEDPTFRQRFLDGLAEELKDRGQIIAAAVAWKWKKIDADKDWQVDEHDIALADAVTDYEMAGHPRMSSESAKEDETATKMRPQRVPMADVRKELGWVPWPPKNEGDESECGCRVSGGNLLMCVEHQPTPAR